MHRPRSRRRNENTEGGLELLRVAQTCGLQISLGLPFCLIWWTHEVLAHVRNSIDAAKIERLIIERFI